MIRVIVRRLLLGIPVLLIVSALTFVLMSLLPGDTATALLGSQASPAQVAKLRLELGLDQPLPLQYWHWLTAALHGDLGFSLLNSQSVVAILNGRLAVTLTLVLLATIVSAVAGVAIGFLSALRGGAVGRVVDFLSFVGLAFPAFWIATCNGTATRRTVPKCCAPRPAPCSRSGSVPGLICAHTRP